MKRIAFLLAGALALPVAWAHGDHQHGDQAQEHQHTQAAAAGDAAALSEGEVRKVDREQGKLSLRHGPLANLDMPGMTMVFRVKDPAMLEQLQTGDKVRFRAERVDGQLTVVQLSRQ